MLKRLFKTKDVRQESPFILNPELHRNRTDSTTSMVWLPMPSSSFVTSHKSQRPVHHHGFPFLRLHGELFA